VIAPREELPLVIGKEGQNARLASKLTGYNIEVEGQTEEVANYTCSVCGAEFETQEDLRKHMEEQHKDEKTRKKKSTKKAKLT